MTQHQKLSYTKSMLRIGACSLLLNVNPIVAALFGLAEILGILEEVGQDYGR